ncbi:SLIT and NTRK-like protein 4 [Odontomachus brunneus]|uniref:SLIT and NTRK-like protein 4 n=1 Tax=Odontomachus brunneus TaxID=486640 RepID=UPI0013F1D64B|nr:SLIT and NTRK-like protein 4 [Odontomachus brunneus]
MVWMLYLGQRSVYFTTKSDEEGSKICDIGRISNDIRQEIFTNQLHNQSHNRSYNNSEKYCDIEAACGSIKCSCIPEEFDPGEVIRTFIEDIFKVKCDKKITINLTLEKSRFFDNKLQEKWLKTDIEIARLTLINCFLTTLSDGAFSSPIFSKMTKLILKDNNISTLNKATFHHLPKLEYLSIVNNEIKEAEKNLLQDVATNLANLQLENAISDTEVLRNITGAGDLWNVKELALRHNRITIINSELFTGVPEIESLYLQYSSIKTICVDAFEPISESIKQIFLNNNNIETLPEGLFDSIILRNSTFLLLMDNNPWHCNYSLMWVQEMMALYPRIVQNIPVCSLPGENTGKFFTNAIFYNQYDNTSTTDKTSEKQPDDQPCVKMSNVTIISIFVSTSILICFISAVLMFVIVRRHPTMLRGSKRIVIVKRGNLDVMVLPKGLSSDIIESANKNTIPTISQNLQEDGYIVLLPPAQNLTDKSSTSSASSIHTSEDTSYISSIEPTLSQLNSWRLKRSECTSRETEPPPLPPHPHTNVAQPLSIMTDTDKDKSDSCTV